jgi:hypothetical protein
VPIVVTNPAPDHKPAAPDRKLAAPGERRLVAMTPYAIAVALFAAFVVGGILGKAVPLWLVAVLGLVFGVVGVFLVVAAATFDANKAQGLDGALRKIAATPLGPWLLVAVALGLVTFGVYSCCEARWRKVRPG